VKAPTVTAAPVTFTDANAPAVAGMTPRQCREFVHKNNIPFARAGRRMLIRVDRFLEVVDRLSGAEPHHVYDESAVIERAARRGGR
jgi:hypothetical protein